MMRTIVVSLGIALAAVTASCSRDASRESTASCPGARRDHHCALWRGRRQRCAEPNDCQCPSRAEARARQSARRESARQQRCDRLHLRRQAGGQSVCAGNRERQLLHDAAARRIEVTYKDFTPVAAIAMSPCIMAVRAASPLKSFEEVKKARRLTTGTVGVVSDPVLLARMLQNATGVTIDTVPFDGEGEVMTAVLGGHIDFMLGNPGEVLPQIEAGTLRPIAVSTGARLQSLSNTPSFKELGYNIEHVQLRGVVMPPSCPPRRSRFGRTRCKK